MSNLINSYSLSSVIGIGTDTPNQNLTVVGGISGNALVYDQTGNSSQWNSVYTSVKANSGSYATSSFVQSNYLNLTGGRVNGNVTFTGNISAQGTAYFANTVFTTSSAISAIVNSSGPALYVSQLGSGDLASFYDFTPAPVEVLHVGASIGTPYVGVYTSNPNVELTVNGRISASQVIYASGGNSNNWNNVYSYVNSTSATNNPTYNATNFSKLSSQAYILYPSTSAILPTVGNNQSIGSVCSYIGSGQNNIICATNSSTYAPACNYNASIFSGCNNTIFACSQGTGLDTGAYICNTFIGGGICNSAITNTGHDDGHIENSTILNGRCNTICQNSWPDSNPGGILNSTIVGGCLNALSGYCIREGVIGGGCNNKIISSSNSDYSLQSVTIAGGYNNTISGCYASFAIIGGGVNNRNCGSYGVLVGGNTNCITSICGGNVIVGGTYQTICGYNGSSFIGGGYRNTTSGYNGSDTIVGGSNNTSSAYYGNNFIGGGGANCIDENATSSVIVGGVLNHNGADCSFIGGGRCNSTSGYGAGYSSVVVGGESNCATYGLSFVGGGAGNRVVGVDNNGIGSSIVGGAGNYIYDTPGAFIGGGTCNFIQTLFGSGPYCADSSIVGGCCNNICNTSPWSLIGGGVCNAICNSPVGRWGAGDPLNYTFISVTSGSSIISGNNNSITPAYGNTVLSNSTITHGNNNRVLTTTSGYYAINGNPWQNTVISCSIVNNVKIGGSNNTIISNACTVASGGDGSLPAYIVNSYINNASVLNGTNNCISSYSGYYITGSGDPGDPVVWHLQPSTVNSATIVNGCNNFINGACTCPSYTTILNGCNNVIPGTYASSILGGINNTASGAYSTVINGKYNNASGYASTVAGGGSNIASGNYSFVAAGSANNTNSQPNTFILGSNITASRPNFTYVNNLSSLGSIYSSALYSSALYSNGIVVSPYAGMRNRIINGDFYIDQRKSGANSLPASTSNLIDRWKYNVNGTPASKIRVGQNINGVASPAGFTSYYGLSVVATSTPGGGDYVFLSQVIEGTNTIDLNYGTSSAQPATLSFYVRSSRTGNFGGFIRNYGTFNRSYPFLYNIPASNTWTYITVSVPGDTTGTWTPDTSHGIEIGFEIANGSTYQAAAGAWTAGNYTGPSGATTLTTILNSTFYVTGVQFEPGIAATPYERRNYGIEYAMCQRYYEILEVRAGGYNTTGNNLRGSGYFRVQKRPSTLNATVISTDESSNLGSLNVDNSNYRYDSVRYITAVTATGDAYGQWQVSIDSEF